MAFIDRLLALRVSRRSSSVYSHANGSSSEDVGKIDSPPTFDDLYESNGGRKGSLASMITNPSIYESIKRRHTSSKSLLLGNLSLSDFMRKDDDPTKNADNCRISSHPREPKARDDFNPVTSRCPELGCNRVFDGPALLAKHMRQMHIHEVQGPNYTERQAEISLSRNERGYHLERGPVYTPCFGEVDITYNHVHERNNFLESSESLMSGVSSTDEPNEATKAFIDQLATKTVAHWLQFKVAGFNQRHGSDNSSVHSSSQSRTMGTSNTSQASSLKRHHRDNEPDEGGGDEGKGNNRAFSKFQKKDVPVFRLFACPYTKFDPERYSGTNAEEAYRTCSTLKLTTITRVKQHLERTHKKPDYYCGRCYQTFGERDSMDSHHQKEPRCEAGVIAKYREMMSDQQCKTIKARWENTAASWYKIFAILFSDAPKPLSPYVSTCDAQELLHFTEFIRFLGPEFMLNLVRDRLEQGEAQLDFNLSLRNIIMETFEVALPQCEQGLEQLRRQFRLDQPIGQNNGLADSDFAGNEGLNQPRLLENIPSAMISQPWSTNVGDLNMPFTPDQVDPEFDAVFHDLLSSTQVEDSSWLHLQQS